LETKSEELIAKKVESASAEEKGGREGGRGQFINGTEGNQ